ncbi:MAG: alpha-ketoacid dehydrogenase subunit beta [Planctomycetia bacterium]|nr:alpha-ketoacid dehydrogenase subunit beta [Planctomycetia bacterium]
MTSMTFREAIRAALREALLNDPKVFLLGEDVGRYGGAFACSKGLYEEFGPERIRDAPLSESGFVGAGIGAAINGMRPIVEIMTVNFSLLALDQILNNAAILRHMSGGQVSVPVVIRMSTGGGRRVAAQHSNSLECWYAHIPGITVLAPATVTDARYMLRQALQEPDPVFIFEHIMLLPVTGEVDETASPMPLRQAAIRRPGKDISLITYGGSLPKVMKSAETLSKQGIDAEVIDLRVLRPLDMKTILQSISRTHRAVIIDEGWKTGSLAGEISAQIMEQGFYDLDAPVARICSAEVPIPYAMHLEDAALPQSETVVKTVVEIMNRHG